MSAGSLLWAKVGLSEQGDEAGIVPELVVCRVHLEENRFEATVLAGFLPPVEKLILVAEVAHNQCDESVPTRERTRGGPMDHLGP